MDNKLTKEEVLHVAKLANIEISEKEMNLYQIQLKQILDEIEKIKDIDNYDEDYLISPVLDSCRLREDKYEEMLEINKVMKNVPHNSGNFIEVPGVINE